MTLFILLSNFMHTKKHWEAYSYRKFVLIFLLCTRHGLWVLIRDSNGISYTHRKPHLSLYKVDFI